MGSPPQSTAVCNNMKFFLLAALVVCATSASQHGHMKWLEVPSHNPAACESVDESNPDIQTGRPADKCEENGEKFCFCGQKGSATKWSFHCGQCKENEPFYFKINAQSGAGSHHGHGHRRR